MRYMCRKKSPVSSPPSTGPSTQRVEPQAHLHLDWTHRSHRNRTGHSCLAEPRTLREQNSLCVAVVGTDHVATGPICLSKAFFSGRYAESLTKENLISTRNAFMLDAIWLAMLDAGISV